MNNILVALVVLCILVSVVYKKWVTDHALKKLYALRGLEDGEKFIEAVDSDFIRFHFSKFTREFMKLNFWISRDNWEEIQKQLPALENMKSSPQEKIALYSKLFGFALQKKRYGEGEAFRKKLEALLAGRTDQKSALMRREVRRLDEIYLKRNAGLIPELEEELETAGGEEKSVLCYRLAKLYHFREEEERAKEYLRQACGFTEDPAARRTLEQAMEDCSLLD